MWSQGSCINFDPWPKMLRFNFVVNISVSDFPIMHALQVLVTARDWPLREKFMSAVRRKLALAPRKPAWYPGSKARLQGECHVPLSLALERSRTASR